MAIVAAEFSRIPQLKGDFLRDQVAVSGTEHLPRTKASCNRKSFRKLEWVAPAMAEFGWKAAGVVRPWTIHAGRIR